MTVRAVGRRPTLGHEGERLGPGLEGVAPGGQHELVGAGPRLEVDQALVYFAPGLR